MNLRHCPKVEHEHAVTKTWFEVGGEDRGERQDHVHKVRNITKQEDSSEDCHSFRSTPVSRASRFNSCPLQLDHADDKAEESKDGRQTSLQVEKYHVCDCVGGLLVNVTETVPSLRPVHKPNLHHSRENEVKGKEEAVRDHCRNHWPLPHLVEREGDGYSPGQTQDHDKEHGIPLTEREDYLPQRAHLLTAEHDGCALCEQRHSDREMGEARAGVNEADCEVERCGDALFPSGRVEVADGEDVCGDPEQ